MATKAALVDSLTAKKTAVIAVGFVVLLFLVAIAGVNGPQAATFKDFQMVIPCLGGCNATGVVRLNDLTAWNQATWVTMRMSRPQRYTSDGSSTVPALLDVGVDFDLAWTGTVTYDGSSSATGGVNVSHVTRVFCPPRQLDCSSVLLLQQPWIQARSTVISATFTDPLARFNALTTGIKPEIVMNFRQGYIDSNYTSFELGWRATFMVFTVFFWLYFVIRLCSGPGNKDESSGEPLKTSPQQIFVAFLSTLLFWFNDPFYLAYITMPSLPLGVAEAFFTATFVACLLFWFLVAFDLARMQGENGLGWDPNTADIATRPGTCFWLPKSLIVSILWTLVMAAYVFVRYSQQSDPAFSVIEAAGSYASWLGTFVAGLGAIYVIYAFVILVLAFRRFGTMSQSNKFITAVTVTSLLLILAGLFSSSFSGARVVSALRLAVYGCSNLYVWFLMLIYLPAPRPEGWGALPGSETGGRAPPSPAQAGVDAEAVPYTGQDKSKDVDETGSADLSLEAGDLDVRVHTDSDAAGQADRGERVRRMSGKIREAIAGNKGQEQTDGQQQEES